MFQSPSLRGSGRFDLQGVRLSLAWEARVSIPFIAGQWSLPDEAARAEIKKKLDVSIPFIAGQWSLL